MAPADMVPLAWLAAPRRYVLQLDDDSYILSPVQRNLVQMFDQEGYLLAARQHQQESAVVSWGLPELARYFLTTQKVAPTILFDFCDPPSIEGLFSSSKARVRSWVPV